MESKTWVRGRLWVAMIRCLGLLVAQGCENDETGAAPEGDDTGIAEHDTEQGEDLVDESEPDVEESEDTSDTAEPDADEVGGCHGFIMLGDNIYDTGPERAEDEQFRTKIDQPYMNLKKRPLPTDNTLRERLPIYVSLGNHDPGGAGLENDLIQYYIDYGRDRPWFYYPSES